MILCSLQNKPCDLSLSLLKQIRIAALHHPTAKEMLAAGQHSGPASPGSGMSWDGAYGVFPAPEASLSTDSSWIKELGGAEHNTINRLNKYLFPLKPVDSEEHGKAFHLRSQGLNQALYQIHLPDR